MRGAAVALLGVPRPLFDNQRALDRDSLFRYAREVGLDIPPSAPASTSPARKGGIAEDVPPASPRGLESTPTLFINGRRVDGRARGPFYDYALVLEQDALALFERDKKARGPTAPRKES